MKPRWECYADMQLPEPLGDHARWQVARMLDQPAAQLVIVAREEHLSWHWTRRGARAAALRHTIDLQHRDAWPLLITYRIRREARRCH